MTRIFVSYSRNEKKEVGEIIRLLEATGYEVWWDGDIPPIADWWATICENIEWCEVFIFFVSEKSVQSPYCLTELKYGTDRNRPILPFLIDDHTQYTIPPEVTPLRNQWFEYDGDAADVIEEVNRAVAHIPWPQFRDNPVPRPPEPKTGSGSTARAFQQAVTLAEDGHFDQAVLRFRDIKSLDFKTYGTHCDNWIRRVQLYAEISELIDHTATHYQVPYKWREYQTVARRLNDTFDPFDLTSKIETIQPTRSRRWQFGLLALTVVLIVSILGAILLLTRDDDSNQSSSQKSTATDNLFAAADTATSTLPTTLASTDTSEPSNTDVLESSNTFTSEPTNTDTPESSNTFTSEPTNTDTAQPTDTYTSEPTNTNTPQPTNTYTAIPTNTPDPNLAIPLAENGVSSNEQWQPYSPHTQQFNGIEMVLVPAGCFMMGSDDGDEDEQPAHPQCFDEPFWIDRTEVTRAHYTECVTAGDCTEPPTSEYSTRDEQPINNVTWFQACDYCAWRDARLPTEREWEYAARGPDNLTYPWGNGFREIYVVYSGNSNNTTADVGSRPDGASWIGAYDMSGNVWEWVSSLYQPYEYNTADGREDSEHRTNVRVLRGGSFNYTFYVLRAANRDRDNPSLVLNDLGFRCARSYALQTTDILESTDTPEALNMPSDDASPTVEPTNTYRPPPTDTPEPTMTPTQFSVLDQCQVNAPSGLTVNLRAGPSTGHEIVGILRSGQRVRVVGQIETSDEHIWWLLSSSYWVRSDVVSQIGGCDDVPDATFEE